jgi:hypothetical protein
LSTLDGECGDFPFFLTGIDILKTYPQSKGVLKNVNFRGANFSHLALSGGPYCGINFKNADLRGAQIAEVKGVYWCIDGIIDRYTRSDLESSNPEAPFGCKLVADDHLACVH